MNKLSRKDVTAILLAGGQGSRMDLQDKAWLNHLGRPMIEHVLDCIRPQAAQIVISRNRDDPRYESLGYTCMADTLPDHAGPLAGIQSCLPLVRTPLTLVVPCDTPALPADLVDRMSQDMNDKDLVIASDGKRLQQLIMLAHTEQLQTVGEYLESGGRSVMGWIESRNYAVTVFAGNPDQFENINTPAQLRE